MAEPEPMATVEGTAIAGVQIVVPRVFADDRGRFVETWRQEWLPGTRPPLQANRADRRAGTLVGPHHHLHQADTWYVPAGRARVGLVDLRRGSPTEGATVVLDLGGDGGADHDHRSIHIPPGVGHGFAALTDVTITYLVDQTYDPADELGVAWDDPDIGLDWDLPRGAGPFAGGPVLSDRDRANPRLADLPDRHRPVWHGPSAPAAP